MMDEEKKEDKQTSYSMCNVILPIGVLTHLQSFDMIIGA